MNQTLEDIDTAIAQKRQELKDLIQDEIDDLESLRHRMQGVGSEVAKIPVAAQRIVGGVLLPPKPSPPVVNRMDAIAKASKRLGKRRRRSMQEKFEIIDELDAAPVKKAVLEKHGVSAQSVINWKNQASAGRIVRGGA